MSDPLLPIRTNKEIENAYVKVDRDDSFFISFETSKEIVIDDIIGADLSLESEGVNDHMIVSAADYSICAMTASYNGSNSGYWLVARKLIMDREGSYSLSATEAADSQIGIISLRKRMYDLGVSSGTLSISVSGLNYNSQNIEDVYFDDGKGNLVKQGDDSIIGRVYPEAGMVIITEPLYREVATHLFSLTYKTHMQHSNLSVFCKCPSDQLNYTLNHTAASTANLDYVGIPNNHDSLYTETTLTASTEDFIYWPDLTSSGYAFSPIISHVGLYNDNNDLLAVAKIANAIKKPSDLPLTIKVSIDL